MVLGYDKLKQTVGHTQLRAKHYREILGRAQLRHWHHLRDGRESQIWHYAPSGDRAGILAPLLPQP